MLNTLYLIVHTCPNTVLLSSGVKRKYPAKNGTDVTGQDCFDQWAGQCGRIPPNRGGNYFPSYQPLYMSAPHAAAGTVCASWHSCRPCLHSSAVQPAVGGALWCRMWGTVGGRAPGCQGRNWGLSSSTQGLPFNPTARKQQHTEWAQLRTSPTCYCPGLQFTLLNPAFPGHLYCVTHFGV